MNLNYDYDNRIPQNVGGATQSSPGFGYAVAEFR